MIGWIAWSAGKRAAKYAAKDAAKGAAPAIDSRTKKPNKSAIALGVATAVGVLAFWKTRGGGEDEDDGEGETPPAA